MTDTLEAQHCPKAARHVEHPWNVVEGTAVGNPHRWCTGTPIYDAEIVRVGVCCFVFSGTRVLMLRREGKHGAGTWSLPGGWMEYGEDPTDTARREVFEETSVLVRPLEVVGWTNDVFVDAGIHGVTFFVLAQHVSGEPQIMEPDKCPEVRWMGVSALEAEALPLFQPLDVFLSSGKRLEELYTLSTLYGSDTRSGR